MKRIFSMVVVALAMWVGVGAVANAETLGQYHLPTDARICFEDKGWNITLDVLPNIAWRLRANGITDAVVWDSCVSQPTNQVVTFSVINDPDNYFCARTFRGGYVNGVATGRTTIQINTASKWYEACRSTWAQRAHLFSHEVGHALGLIHNNAASVMGSWSYVWYTTKDYADLHSIYDN